MVCRLPMRGGAGRALRASPVPAISRGEPVGSDRCATRPGDRRTGSQPGPLLQEPLPAAAIDWACALTATALPEGQPYQRLYQAFDGLLSAIEAAPSASGWGTALVRYELLLLAELGFGLDLEKCVSGGNDELVAVSPRSGRAVSAALAEPYAGKLPPLPPFILAGGIGSWPKSRRAGAQWPLSVARSDRRSIRARGRGPKSSA